MSLKRALIRTPALTAATAALATGAVLVPAPAQAAPVATTTVASVATQTAAAPTAAQRRAVAAQKVAVKRAGLMRTAAALKGRPYRYGATGPSAFDCSGYTRYVFAKNGISLPRTSSAQYSKARRISKASAKKGDLVFFGSGRGVYHVGVYAGNGKMWHSPRPGKSVRLIKIWTSNWSAGRVV